MGRRGGPLARFEDTTGRAAHEPVVVSSSAALGWGLPTGRRQTSVVLAEGDRAWFFTDGLIEARADRAFLEREGLERIIGARMGTGGSAGAEYLRSTLFRPAFPDLWAVRGADPSHG